MNQKKAGPGKFKDRLENYVPGVWPGYNIPKQKIQARTAPYSKAVIPVNALKILFKIKLITRTCACEPDITPVFTLSFPDNR